MQAQPGHFYAVGIGPGSPDLLTVRAVDIIKSADIILSPQAKGSNRSLALNAIAPYLSEQEVMTVNYPMQRNGNNTRERWKSVAAEVLEKLQQGKIGGDDHHRRPADFRHHQLPVVRTGRRSAQR